MSALTIGPVATIFGMAAITLAWRLVGFWAMGRVRVTPRIERFLKALPGCIIVATVIPAVLQGGFAAALALGATLATMIATRNESGALMTGLVVAAGLRAAGYG